jgi:hypothetical protein
LCAHSDHGEVDGTGHVLDAAVDGHAAELSRLGVDGVQASSEAAGAQVGEQRRPDRRGAARAADDGNR